MRGCRCFKHRSTLDLLLQRKLLYVVTRRDHLNPSLATFLSTPYCTVGLPCLVGAGTEARPLQSSSQNNSYWLASSKRGEIYITIAKGIGSARTEMGYTSVRLWATRGHTSLTS